MSRRHHIDTVTEQDRFVDVVGNEQHGLVRGLPDVEQQFLHQSPCLVVERAERLVHQQNRRIVGECPRQRHTLHHPAGKLLRI